MIAVLAGLVAGTTVSQAEEPSCETGLRFTANGTGAAMGLRMMSVEVTNCGSEPLELNGYPQVKVLDAQHEQLDVAILEGSGGIAAIEGFDDAPQPITVAPGESAKSAFLWRNTHASVDPPLVGKHVDIAAAAGDTWQPLVPTSQQGSILIDLGSTGRIGVQAWHRE
ncbi:DUF4232 domain-containing protein [Lentzea sp. BCCO 10_0798]|uniref:DUF4232 domain-containing protein n=1 Tax=Lentzea kristufekii TaxID=3095430 RepID=A0ABU4TIC9_9PSEU|nr:DUF4232 domain-containing protein [Lentzea sp. BCCO 10_0798]MDX8047955.1 DUF4232 domain-containing protein [Lentzea sp. BCCO 10_0798]